GGSVLAVATVRGALPNIPPRVIQFSGYQWEVRDDSKEASESSDYYGSGNVWTDGQGFLHLKVMRARDRWVTAEVKLSRSLGYGSYVFVVKTVAHRERGAVFAMYTFDYQGPSREMDIEVSRWGEPQDKNAQYIIQPYIVPANTIRFNAPAGKLTYWMDWGPG